MSAHKLADALVHETGNKLYKYLQECTGLATAFYVGVATLHGTRARITAQMNYNNPHALMPIICELLMALRDAPELGPQQKSMARAALVALDMPADMQPAQLQ